MKRLQLDAAIRPPSEFSLKTSAGEGVFHLRRFTIADEMWQTGLKSPLFTDPVELLAVIMHQLRDTGEVERFCAEFKRDAPMSGSVEDHVAAAKFMAPQVPSAVYEGLAGVLIGFKLEDRERLEAYQGKKSVGEGKASRWRMPMLSFCAAFLGGATAMCLAWAFRIFS